MFSFFFIILFLSFIAGISSLIDSSFLGLLVNSTGPLMGYGFLTIVGDGFKLFSKNPWISYLSVCFSFLFYNFETMSLNLVFLTYDVGLVLLGFLGVSGMIILLSYIYFFSGYSTLGKYSSQCQILMGEGMFSLFLLLILLYSCFDYLFYDEQNYFCSVSFYTMYLFYIVFYLMLMGESHPWDMPESESDLGGGMGMNFSSLFFMLFAMLEYSWLLVFLTLCYMVKWSILFYLFYLFLFSGIMPRFSYKLFLEKVWFYFPMFMGSFLFFSFSSMMLEFCFLFSMFYF